jgi:hypothetical protein
MLALFICVAAVAAAAMSVAFYFAVKRFGIYKKSLIAAVTALNAAFCAAFPLLFAAIGGGAGGDGAPRSPAAAIAALAALTAIYVIIVVWRVALRSPSLRLNVPIPGPDASEPANGTENEKNIVDSATNLGKMGMNIELHRNIGENDVNSLINLGFDCLNGGKMEEAAGYFFNAIEKHPPLGLELQIAIQLCMIYLELGRADLSFEILSGYDAEYRDRLSGEDRERLDAGLAAVRPAIAGVGGDGYEKD